MMFSAIRIPCSTRKHSPSKHYSPVSYQDLRPLARTILVFKSSMGLPLKRVGYMKPFCIITRVLDFSNTINRRTVATGPSRTNAFETSSSPWLISAIRTSKQRPGTTQFGLPEFLLSYVTASARNLTQLLWTLFIRNRHVTWTGGLVLLLGITGSNTNPILRLILQPSLYLLRPKNDLLMFEYNM